MSFLNVSHGNFHTNLLMQINITRIDTDVKRQGTSSNKGKKKNKRQLNIKGI